MIPSRTSSLTVLLMCVTLSIVPGWAHNARKLLENGYAEPYGQCGGQTCSNGSPLCSDLEYLSCPSGYTCHRESQWYWQCQPAASASGTAAPATAPAYTPGQTFPPRIYHPPSQASSSSPSLSTPALAPAPSTEASIDCKDTPYYLFKSYLDNTGIHAPDGNYKETCKSIKYDCITDILTARCGNDDSVSHFNTSSLSNASVCWGGTTWNIYNVWGFLECQTIPAYASEEPTPVSEGEAPSPEASEEVTPASPEEDPYGINPYGPCGSSAYLYESKLDSTGLDAPDGNYKETCLSIGYDCNTDTLYAKCGNGKHGSDHAYILSSLEEASDCYSVTNEHGYLYCDLSF